MIYNLLSLLLNTAASVLGSACLLRAYLQWHKISFKNPLGQFVLALTNWLVLPLRRVVPSAWGVDVASVLGAFLLLLVQLGLLWALAGAGLGVEHLPVLALLGLLKLAISLATGVLVVYIVMSWLNPNAPMFYLFNQLTEPMVRPLRRVIPPIGGIDFSCMVTILILQVASILLAGVPF